MQGPWEAMLTFSEDAKLKDARQNLRMQGYPWEICSSLLCGLTVTARAERALEWRRFSDWHPIGGVPATDAAQPAAPAPPPGLTGKAAQGAAAGAAGAGATRQVITVEALTLDKESRVWNPVEVRLWIGHGYLHRPHQIRNPPGSGPSGGHSLSNAPTVLCGARAPFEYGGGIGKGMPS